MVIQKKRLSVNPQFLPCPVSDNDELFPVGIFEFNVSRLIEYIQGNKFPVGETVVADFPQSFSSVDENHVDNVDVSRPVILAEICPGRFNLIDGNHRMEKARRLGLKLLPAIRVGPDVHVNFLTSVKAYRAYVEHWNGKVG